MHNFLVCNTNLIILNTNLPPPLANRLKAHTDSVRNIHGTSQVVGGGAEGTRNLSDFTLKMMESVRFYSDNDVFCHDSEMSSAGGCGWSWTIT